MDEMFFITDPEDPSKIYAGPLSKEATGVKLTELLRPLLTGSDFHFIRSAGSYQSIDEVLEECRKELSGCLYFDVVPASVVGNRA
ncbi:MAG: hypothetical protein JWN18_408 [Parcubacteria group bacterium]|nr:hypothetical protein [Parcubacteria group bacterium]